MDYFKYEIGITILNDISEFNEKKKTKYYIIKKLEVEHNILAKTITSTLSGKSRNSINYKIYFATPILSFSKPSLINNYSCWFGLKYSKSFNNKLSNEMKTEKLNQFFDNSINDFDSINFNKYGYLELLGNTYDRNEYYTAIENKNRTRDISKFIFIKHNKSYSSKNGYSLLFMLLSFFIGNIIFILLLSNQKFKTNYVVWDSYSY